MKRIPLHSLVIMVGPALAGKSHIANATFPRHEILCSEEIRIELCGDVMRHDLNDIVFREIHRRAAIKLELGERVVIDAANLRKKDRSGLAGLGLRLGVPIFYLVVDRPIQDKLNGMQYSWRSNAYGAIQKQDQVFKASEREILKGDMIANVVDTRKEEFEAVEKVIQNTTVRKQINDRGYRGVLAIGDIHGMIEPLKNATEWASSRNLFCVFMGDIVDYGPNSIECVDHVYDVLTRGRGVAIIGNHERKIERWIEQSKQGEIRLRLSDGNKVTTEEIDNMIISKRIKFETKFNAMVNLSRNHWVIGNTLFTHGAAEPEMFNIFSPRLSGRFENMALFGEVDNDLPPRADGYPNRVYDWVNRIPSGKKVFVGHDIRSTMKPLNVTGSMGGEACFMDTGCGKGGRLTTADIIFDGDDLKVQAFKYH